MEPTPEYEGPVVGARVAGAGLGLLEAFARSVGAEPDRLLVEFLA